MTHTSFSQRDLKPRARVGSTGILRPLALLLGVSFIALSLFLWINSPETAAHTQHVTALALPGQLESPAAGIPELQEMPAGGPATPEQLAMVTPAQAAIGTNDTDSAQPWQVVEVKPGDSLAAIFDRLDIAPQQLHAILESGGAASNLKKIFPGQTFRVQTDEEEGLMRLSYQIDKLNALEIRRDGDGFDISTVTRTPEFRTRSASGIIDSSLFVAAGSAGLSDNLTMELAGIFGWDIDFALDIRKGDHFTVLYEELWLDGEHISDGNILAAEFVNHGRTYQAVRYTDAGGKTDFYSLDGKSMRKAFLRTPVEFSRISSRFSLGRKHPILNRIRAHKGVDYAAASGTPVRATGDGKIVHRSTKGGYGNTVIIQHGTKYNTLYAHLSKYRGNQRVGSRVKQGQIIGYVGSSGLATGPHLHYEFRVDGVHRDPLRVKLPGADPLQQKYLDDFNSKAESLLAQLDLVRSNYQVASNDEQ